MNEYIISNEKDFQSYVKNFENIKDAKQWIEKTNTIGIISKSEFCQYLCSSLRARSICAYERYLIDPSLAKINGSYLLKSLKKLFVRRVIKPAKGYVAYDHIREHISLIIADAYI